MSSLVMGINNIGGEASSGWPLSLSLMTWVIQWLVIVVVTGSDVASLTLVMSHPGGRPHPRPHWGW